MFMFLSLFGAGEGKTEFSEFSFPSDFEGGLRFLHTGGIV